MIILRCWNCIEKYTYKCKICGGERLYKYLATRYAPLTREYFACEDCELLIEETDSIDPHFCSKTCEESYKKRK